VQYVAIGAIVRVVFLTRNSWTNQLKQAMLPPPHFCRRKAMSRTKSWEVSDKLWSLVEPLIPERKRDPNKTYKRKPGAGRPPIDKRTVFEAIVYVLRTGCQWKALPKEVYGSPSSIHRYFMNWSEAGVFLALWKVGLDEYDELKGIQWEWQSIDGAMHKAPLAQESAGPNPTDRGKNGDQASPPYRRQRSAPRSSDNRSKPA